MNIEWKESTNTYGSNGEDMFLGRWKVASVGWDGVNHTDEKWIVYFSLPGLKSRLKQQFKDVEDAKRRAEKAIDLWVKESTIGV